MTALTRPRPAADNGSAVRRRPRLGGVAWVVLLLLSAFPVFGSIADLPPTRAAASPPTARLPSAL